MAKYSVGQKVKVIDDGKVYSTYYDWATDNKFSFSDGKIRELWAKYLTTEKNACESGTELTVIATGCHGYDRCLAIYLCEDARGNPVLISEAGLIADVHTYNSKVIAELEKENRELKSFIRDLIHENHNLCFQFSNTFCSFNSDYRNRAEELIGEKL